MKKVPARRRRPSCPAIGSLMRYGERIVWVVAEASGQRAVIESIDEHGRKLRSTVKWINLVSLTGQLF
jgi:hypothetical protein